MGLDGKIEKAINGDYLEYLIITLIIGGSLLLHIKHRPFS